MSASFLAGSSQSLTNASPGVINFPFSLGFWVRPTTTGTVRTLFSLATGVNNAFLVRQTATDVWNMASIAAGTSRSSNAGTVVANAWYFLYARFISSTFRQLNVFNASDGSIDSVDNTQASSPGMASPTMMLGAWFDGGGAGTPNQFFSGEISEFWYSSGDATLNSNFMFRPLAYGGPFFRPNIRQQLCEYRSLREHPTTYKINETYYGSTGPKTWTNSNGVTIKDHPPLPYWYKRPVEAKQLAVV